MRGLPRELPPTAGLPLRLADLRPSRADLAAILAGQLQTPPLQLTCSGTAALLLALRVLHARQPGRSVVVVPAYTCPLVAIAVHQAGLQLRLCDLRPGHFDMDPQALAAACGEDTLAVLPTHLAGRVADVGTALAVAARSEAFVIEDAAQALGARSGGTSVGLRGDVGFFSLAAGKGLSIFEGGLLVSRDASLREALREAAEQQVPHRRAWEARRSVELLGLAALYRPRGLAFAYGRPLRRALRRGDPVAAVGDAFPAGIPLHRVGRWRQAVGANAAGRLPGFLATLERQAKARLARLRAIAGVEVFDDAPDTQGSWPCLLLQLPDERCRDRVLAQLWTRGLGVSRLFIHALPDYAYLADRVPPAPVPNARAFAQRTLTIGNSPWLDAATFERIATVIERAVS
ncbi:MAG TPA: DegT/DnrJ/EryC1/StrS family aminotransferase [Frateuria sp.]|uniref:DegT/DnrJ/EryC1/StrS family aminotransferase n=1 Tax=Frateuria sp. TaxID=2211372 RepID=UPI002D7F092D|nr:DegT/DnrJ/EryC1/StrS family aminotransferase [Frateuria sp.]HET6803957.1 DegT/DnrJ/EryC1/StrS family aminotransferase [Frateuria sp.]